MGVNQHQFPREPRRPAPPLPAWGPGSYSSPSQTEQPARKALCCQQRPWPWLPAGWVGAREGGLVVPGWRAPPRLPGSSMGRVPRVFLGSPSPPVLALNPACTLASPAAGSPVHVSCPCATGSQGKGPGRSPGHLWCWSLISRDVRPTSHCSDMSISGLTLLHCPCLPLSLSAPLCHAPHSWLLPALPGFSHPQAPLPPCPFPNE